MPEIGFEEIIDLKNIAGDDNDPKIKQLKSMVGVQARRCEWVSGNWPATKIHQECEIRINQLTEFKRLAAAADALGQFTDEQRADLVKWKVLT
jgi:hypothetical protein